MKIKVFGEPNKFAKVKIRHPIRHTKIIKKLFRFDNNGEKIIETDEVRPRVLKALLKNRKYESVEEKPEFACKYCGEIFDTSGKRQGHYMRGCPKKE